MKFLISILFALLVATSFGQNSIAVSNTKLVAGCMLNDSSFAVSATQVDVSVVPSEGEIYVKFENSNALDMSKNAEMYYAKRDILFEWRASFFGLDEMLKNDTESQLKTEGTVLITIGTNTLELPTTLQLDLVDGTQGVTKLVTMSGVFDPNYFEMNSEEFKWDEEFTYSIIFRTTAF